MSIRIFLFGPFRIERDGRTLSERIWRSRQERRLLLVLLLARGATVSLARLIEAVWPSADPEHATPILRSAISSLRTTLSPNAGRAATTYIETRPGGYAWNQLADVWVDLDAFVAGFEGRDSAPAEADLERVIALYRGELLEDEIDAPWAMAAREQYRMRFLRAIESLALARLSRNEQRSAIELARRGLGVDALNEVLCRILMQAYAQIGDIAAALQTYERFRLLLDHELGAVPSAQTQSMHAAILRGELEIAISGKQPTTAHTEATTLRRSLAVQRRPTVQPALPPIVGRAAELAQLRAWVVALERRDGGVVTLFGEAGIGKTRLLQELSIEAERRDALVILLRCTPVERTLPLASLAEALRPLIRNAPQALLDRLPEMALAQLSELIPTLRQRLPQLPQLVTLPADQARSRLVEGVIELTLALARLTPLVICCDDAQWADETLLAVIIRLARLTRGRAMLLVLTYRAEELAESPGLHALLRELGRDMVLRPVLLGPLDASAMHELLAAPARGAALAARLVQQSEGNPLLLRVGLQSVLEMYGVRSLAALPDGIDSQQLPDPARIAIMRDLVGARLDRLTETARDLLEQIAILGRPVSLDLIEELAGETGLQAAQLLLDRQFLAELDPQRLGFAHEVTRATILNHLGAPRQRLLHRQVARALAHLHGASAMHAAEIALHLSQSGRAADPELLRYALLAGEYATSVLGDAQHWYAEAQAAAERLGVAVPNQLIPHQMSVSTQRREDAKAQES